MKHILDRALEGVALVAGIVAIVAFSIPVVTLLIIGPPR